MSGFFVAFKKLIALLIGGLSAILAEKTVNTSILRVWMYSHSYSEWIGTINVKNFTCLLCTGAQQSYSKPTKI